MKKRTYTILNLLIIAGAVLLFASFFMQMADITIQGNGYSASGFQLSQGKIASDYLSGVIGTDHFYELRAYYPALYGLLLFSLLSLPVVLVRRDMFLRFLASLFGIFGPGCALYGYWQFREAAVSGTFHYDMTVNAGYGLVVAVLAGILIVLGNISVIIIKNNENKKPTSLED